MDPQASKPPEHGSLASLAVACALVGAAILPVTVAIGWFAYGRSGSAGIAAAAISGGVCWVAASLALTITFVSQRLQCGVQGILGAMLVRMGLPLATGMAFTQLSPALAHAGVFLMILVVYLAALAVETPLSLRFIPRTTPVGKSLQSPAAIQGQ